MSLVIEPFTESEMDRVAEVLRLAYKVDRDYHYLLRLHLFVQPRGCLVARLHNVLVGFGAATNYGPFSYIALMGTHPDVQRQGVARRILEMLTAWTEASGTTTILLDSSAAGERLYETSGFTTIDSTVVFRRELQSEPGMAVPDPGSTGRPNIDIAELVAFDSPAFGADRGRVLGYLLSQVPKRFIVSREENGKVDGFLVAQGNQVIGPWVASSSTVAEKLLSRALREFSFVTPPEVLTSKSNTAACELLARHGFREQRVLRHMSKGKPIERGRAIRIYGQTSLGLG